MQHPVLGTVTRSIFVKCMVQRARAKACRTGVWLKDAWPKAALLKAALLKAAWLDIRSHRLELCARTGSIDIYRPHLKCSILCFARWHAILEPEKKNKSQCQNDRCTWFAHAHGDAKYCRQREQPARACNPGPAAGHSEPGSSATAAASLPVRGRCQAQPQHGLANTQSKLPAKHEHITAVRQGGRCCPAPCHTERSPG